MANSYPPVVVDPRFAAGRGEEFSAARQMQRKIDEIEQLAALDGEDFRLPIDHRVEDALDLTGVDQASLHVPLPESNVGFRLLAKMGWTPGSGLGRNGAGKTCGLLVLDGCGRIAAAPTLLQTCFTPCLLCCAGITEPVALDTSNNGTWTGLGRDKMDREFYAAENVSRRALETEVQAHEDAERALKREVVTLIHACHLFLIFSLVQR